MKPLVPNFDTVFGLTQSTAEFHLNAATLRCTLYIQFVHKQCTTPDHESDIASRTERNVPTTSGTTLIQKFPARAAADRARCVRERSAEMLRRRPHLSTAGSRTCLSAPPDTYSLKQLAPRAQSRATGQQRAAVKAPGMLFRGESAARDYVAPTCASPLYTRPRTRGRGRAAIAPRCHNARTRL